MVYHFGQYKTFYHIIQEIYIMNPTELTQKLIVLNIRPDEIPDKKMAADICLLFQIIEELSMDNEKLRAENRMLSDEINKLKREQSKPDISVPEKKRGNDTSSEDERKKRKTPEEKKSKSKKDKIKIDRTEVCRVNKSILPEDAEFKGYQNVVVQEISIRTDNVEYKKEVYYSSSLNKTYIADLPKEIEGEFGPEVKSLIIILKNSANMSEPKIKEFFDNFGIYISQSTISRVLTKNIEPFHKEKEDIFQAGLCSGVYQQIDGTGAKVSGQNYHTQILCNPFYTAYFTLPHKNRLSILNILYNGNSISYYFNEEAFALLEIFRLSKKVIVQLRETASGKILDEEQMQELLENIFPDPEKGKNQRTRIMEAGAVAFYHHQEEFPTVDILLSDDAPEYKLITSEQGLCRIHEGRHYKKLIPAVPFYEEKLEEFRDQYWDYYRKLLDYKENPSDERAEELSAEFDELFSVRTDYPALDDRIAKTEAKKSELLLVLKYPELPLHNNEAELGARVIARKRDVSLHTITEEGTKANDTFLTIVETAKKLGVSAYEYIRDRVAKRFEMPSLADMIRRISGEEKTPVSEYDDTS